MAVRIDRVRTNGVFTLDGQSFDVENNIWLVGNDDEVLVIDAAHEAGPILEGVGNRRVKAIVCTHGHNSRSSTTIGDEAPHLDEWIARGHSFHPTRNGSHSTFLVQQGPQM